MKKVIFLLALTTAFASCNNTTKENNSQDSIVNDVLSIGGNKDEHGCLPSAGQTWSKIKNDCIQVFSVGTRLNPVQVDSTAAIISAFVVSNEDSTAYELFLADNKETVILNKQKDETFSERHYQYNKMTGELSINQKVAYKAE